MSKDEDWTLNAFDPFHYYASDHPWRSRGDELSIDHVIKPAKKRGLSIKRVKLPGSMDGRRDTERPLTSTATGEPVESYREKIDVLYLFLIRLLSDQATLARSLEARINLYGTLAHLMQLFLKDPNPDTMKMAKQLEYHQGLIREGLLHDISTHLRVVQLEFSQFLTILSYTSTNASKPITDITPFQLLRMPWTLEADAFVKAFRFQSMHNLNNLQRIKLPFLKTVLTDLSLIVNHCPEIISQGVFSGLQVLWTNVVMVYKELTSLIGFHRNHLSVIVGLLGEVPYDLFLPKRLQASDWANKNRHELFQVLESTKKPKFPIVLPPFESGKDKIAVTNSTEFFQYHDMFRQGLEDPEVMTLCLPDSYPCPLPNLSTADGLPLLNIASEKDFRTVLCGYAEYVESFKAFDSTWIADLTNLSSFMDVLARALPLDELAIEIWPLESKMGSGEAPSSPRSKRHVPPPSSAPPPPSSSGNLPDYPAIPISPRSISANKSARPGSQVMSNPVRIVHRPSPPGLRMKSATIETLALKGSIKKTTFADDVNSGSTSELYRAQSAPRPSHAPPPRVASTPPTPPGSLSTSPALRNTIQPALSRSSPDISIGHKRPQSQKLFPSDLGWVPIHPTKAAASPSTSEWLPAIPSVVPSTMVKPIKHDFDSSELGSRAPSKSKGSEAWNIRSRTYDDAGSDDDTGMLDPGELMTQSRLLSGEAKSEADYTLQLGDSYHQDGAKSELGLSDSD